MFFEEMQRKALPFTFSEFEINLRLAKVKNFSDERKAQYTFIAFCLIWEKVVCFRIEAAYAQFCKYRRKMDQEDYLTRDDIALHAYEIWADCMKKLDTKRIKTFVFYFTKALSRRFSEAYRNRPKEESLQAIYQRKQVRKQGVINNRAAQVNFNTQPVIDTLGLTPQEERLLKSRMSGQKIELFVEAENITPRQYYMLMASLRQKAVVLL